jgi:predicted signal transduction protein with EAL and GGDEF domain
LAVTTVWRQPYDLSRELGRRLSVTASIGIAVGIQESADELLRNADLALYEAKTTGRDRYVSFKPSMQTASHDRLMLEMDLGEALQRRQLFLAFQPICARRPWSGSRL